MVPTIHPLLPSSRKAMEYRLSVVFDFSALHVRPPSTVRRIVPSSPTRTPRDWSRNAKPQRSTFLGAQHHRQVSPGGAELNEFSNPTLSGGAYQFREFLFCESSSTVDVSAKSEPWRDFAVLQQKRDQKSPLCVRVHLECSLDLISDPSACHGFGCQNDDTTPAVDHALSNRPVKLRACEVDVAVEKRLNAQVSQPLNEFANPLKLGRIVTYERIVPVHGSTPIPDTRILLRFSALHPIFRLSSRVAFAITSRFYISPTLRERQRGREVRLWEVAPGSRYSDSGGRA